MKTLYLNISRMNFRSEASNVFLYSLGKLVSIFGTTIFNFAIGLYVLKLTGSGLSFAAALILSIIPKIIIYPFAGVLADRFDKKTMVIIMDLLNGVMFIGLYLLSSSSGLILTMIFGVTLLMNVFTCFFGISFEAALPNIVSGKMLMNINSGSRIIDSLSSIIRIASCIAAICVVMTGLPTIFITTRDSDMRYLIYYCIIMSGFGMAISIIDIPLSYIMQKSIPDEYRGRVISMMISMAKIIAPLALLVSGFLLNLIPAHVITTLGGILLMAFIGIPLRNKKQ